MLQTPRQLQLLVLSNAVPRTEKQVMVHAVKVPEVVVNVKKEQVAAVNAKEKVKAAPVNAKAKVLVAKGVAEKNNNKLTNAKMGDNANCCPFLF